MNTNALKRFATVSRTLLMKGVRTRLAQVGFNEDGTVKSEPTLSGNEIIFNGRIIEYPNFYSRWQELRRQIDRHGVKEVIEQAAYTWFNRFMAIRILDRNNLAPDVLQYENSAVRIPKIVTDARGGKTPVLNELQRAALDHVIFDGTKTYEQFSILIQAYCENNAIIRSCFGGITDYTMLLLPPDILGEGNFIDLLNETSSLIERDDYRKPELIGWLYQFYIADKKDIVMAKKGGYESDEIPAATQIFTPNWIVKYMVENTLGRIYLDNNPGSHIAENWKYLVNPAEPTPADAVLRYNSLEQLTCADLSCGSGHILNEMFDLLYQLYEEDFYSPREAIEAIFRKNMVGIDIDVRAQQLAMFALLLKACQRDSAFTDGHCLPRIYSFPDPYEDSDLQLRKDIEEVLGGCDETMLDEFVDSIHLFKDASVLGSIMKFPIKEDSLEMIKFLLSSPFINRNTEAAKRVIPYFIIIYFLSSEYASLCMNPPYMPTNRVESLRQYTFKNYRNAHIDLFATFMSVANRLIKHNGKYGMINMQSWAFLSSYEDLRRDILNNYHIDSFIHLGARTFEELKGEIVQNAVFVITKNNYTYPSTFFDCSELKSSDSKRSMFLTQKSQYIIDNSKKFLELPSYIFAYWISERVRNIFIYQPALEEFAYARVGMFTGDNKRFLRNWWEILNNNFFKDCNSFEESLSSNKKWYPYNKGGKRRRWYGNYDLVVNYLHGGDEIYNFAKLEKRNCQDYPSRYKFKPNITWSTAGEDAYRYQVKGTLYDTKGMSMFTAENYLNYILAFCNSVVGIKLIKTLSPNTDTQVGQVRTLPLILKPNKQIDYICLDCISISKSDWDAHETSWDFKINPLIAIDEKTYFDNIDWTIEKHRRATGEQIAIEPSAPQYNSLEWRYNQFCQKWEYLFDSLHRNEEEINRRFIEIYGLQDELNPHVEYEDITILQNGEISLYRPTHAMDMYKFTEEEKQNYIKAGGLIEGDMVIAFQSLITWNKDVIIKQLISYAVGCMMGRYRLDRPGLAIAHPNPSAEEIAEYVVPQTGKSWWIDDDGIVPMMDDDCGFHDNASNRFSEFIEAVFGTESKTENLNFVREALGKDIVDYFRNNFYADHKKMYQNRPIYWMFSSNQKGKRAAFQCLVYMHRMNRFTPEHIRTNYLLPYIETLAAREADLSSRTSLTARENKQLKQIKADLEECREYQLRLHDFADQQIEIDLDDGVVKNYATFAPVLAKLK